MSTRFTVGTNLSGFFSILFCCSHRLSPPFPPALQCLCLFVSSPVTPLHSLFVSRILTRSLSLYFLLSLSPPSSLIFSLILTCSLPHFLSPSSSAIFSLTLSYSHPALQPMQDKASIILSCVHNFQPFCRQSRRLSGFFVVVVILILMYAFIVLALFF